jgi:hypothetical protein
MTPQLPQRIPLAHRLDELNGKTIYLVDCVVEGNRRR